MKTWWYLLQDLDRSASIVNLSCQLGNGCDRLWKKSKFPLHHVPYVFNWWEIWWSCWPGAVVHHEEHVESQLPYVDVRCPAEKHSTFLSKKWQHVQCSRHCLLYPAETPNVTASSNWCPPHHDSWGGGLCVVGESILEDDAHQVYAISVYVHHSHTDRTCSHHWRQQSAIPPFTRHQSSRAWWCRGVSGSLARGTRDLSPAASTV